MLQGLLEDHRGVFILKLETGGPGHITPMKSKIDRNKKPIKVNVRRYPADKKALFKTYVDKLIHYDILIPDSTVSWQAAPHLVPKLTKDSKYRIIIDLRPVNSESKAKV